MPISEVEHAKQKPRPHMANHRRQDRRRYHIALKTRLLYPVQVVTMSTKVIWIMLVTQLAAQTPPPAGGGGRAGRGGGGRAGGFTQFTRPLASQDVLARGNTLFEANCASCHASDMRGTEKGVNILRSGIALRDQHGELVGEVLAKHSPPVNMVPADTTAIAEYIHSILATADRQGSPPRKTIPVNVLVGDANAGKTYFAAHCANCHSVTGDLKGIASKYEDDPRGLQGAWVAGTASGPFRAGRGGGGAGQPATVTLASGEKIQGKLVKRTDFLVVLTLADGTRKSWARENGIPAVDVVDPQAAHKKMALELDDPENKNMHDVTAYLATLK
jgi:cytochrome c oxidase cbb3-type subunit 3